MKYYYISIYFYVVVTEKLPIKNKISTAKIQTEH